MKLIYDIGDKPRTRETIVFAFQQMIAIMAATLLVPILMSTYTMTDGTTLTFDPAAALFGAGIGSLVYIFFTKRRSPVFLGSSFTFLGAYQAVIGMNYGYWGVIIGVIMAGLVYVVIALIIKVSGSAWVNKLMPAVIIGPIITLIGLSLSGTATSWMATNGGGSYSLITIAVGVVTFLAIVLVSVKGSKTLKLIPFIVGIGAGYVLALILTLIGSAANIPSLQILSFDAFKNVLSLSASPPSWIIPNSHSSRQSRQTVCIRWTALLLATSPLPLSPLLSLSWPSISRIIKTSARSSTATLSPILVLTAPFLATVSALQSEQSSAALPTPPMASPSAA